MKHESHQAPSSHNNEHHESNDAQPPATAEDLAFSDLATLATSYKLLSGTCCYLLLWMIPTLHTGFGGDTCGLYFTNSTLDGF